MTPKPPPATKKPNTLNADRLWRELQRRAPALVPTKTDWVPVTKQRLRNALRRMPA